MAAGASEAVPGDGLLGNCPVLSQDADLEADLPDL